MPRRSMSHGRLSPSRGRVIHDSQNCRLLWLGMTPRFCHNHSFSKNPLHESQCAWIITRYHLYAMSDSRVSFYYHVHMNMRLPDSHPVTVWSRVIDATNHQNDSRFFPRRLDDRPLELHRWLWQALLRRQYRNRKHRVFVRRRPHRLA